MLLAPAEYAPLLRDDQVERDIVRELKKQPESDRLHFIREMINTGDPSCFSVGFWLAKRCLCERAFLLQFLEDGLTQGDASTVKYWMQVVMPSLGYHRVISLLQQRLSTDPESVIRALYWLRAWMPTDNNHLLTPFNTLNQAVNSIVKSDPTVWLRAKPFAEYKPSEDL